MFLVSGMFMLGLENTKIFGALMFAGMLGIVCQVSIVSFLKGSLDNFHLPEIHPKGQIGVAVSCALLCFIYPMENPKRMFGRLLKSKQFNGLMICIGIVLFFAVMTTGCLTALIKSHPEGEDNFIAVPVIRIMEDQNLSKIIPAVLCMLVLASSGALMELFPEMYQKMVQLTTSDWRILAKQIGFENKDTGSPVLAIFTSGSLCAMMAFACPLQNLLCILAGSHLLGVVFRAIYLLYIPFRPRVVVSQDSSSTLNYSRLDSEAGGTTATGDVASGTTSSMTVSASIRKLWNMTKSETNPVNFPKKRKRKVPKNPLEHEEMEREWLLLGEPQSPRLDRVMGTGDDIQPVDNESEIVDTQLIGEETVIDQLVVAGEDEEEEEEDESTDIDAIVDEYREKVRVTTGGPLEANVLLRIPSASSWRFALFLICMLFCAVSLLDLGIYQCSLPYLITGAVGIIAITLVLHCTPKHANQKQKEYQNVGVTVITLCGSLILMVSTLSQSWPALLFWLVSGLSLIIRCDLWCCPCLDKTEDVAILHETIFASTHQLYLSDAQPTLVIANPMPKGHLLGSR